MISRLLTLAALLTVLASCASAPSREDAENTDDSCVAAEVTDANGRTVANDANHARRCEPRSKNSAMPLLMQNRQIQGRHHD